MRAKGYARVTSMENPDEIRVFATPEGFLAPIIGELRKLYPKAQVGELWSPDWDADHVLNYFTVKKLGDHQSQATMWIVSRLCAAGWEVFNVSRSTMSTNYDMRAEFQELHL